MSTTIVTLYISGVQSQIIDFYADLNGWCAGDISISFVVIDPLGVCSYDLDTTGKSDAFYSKITELFTLYNSLNFTIV